MNRRTKGGPTDHDLPVLFVHDAEGQGAGGLPRLRLPLRHAVAQQDRRRLGRVRGARRSRTTFPGAVALVAIGCGADQNPNSGVTGDKVDVAPAQGREIAAEVKRLSQNFLAPVTGDDHREGHDARAAARRPADPRAVGGEGEARWTPSATTPASQLAKLDRGEKLPTKIDYPVQTWAFGDSLAMVFLPGEVVVDYALRLKKELDGQPALGQRPTPTTPRATSRRERVLKEGGYEGGGAMIYYDLPAAVQAGPRRARSSAP